MGLAKLTKAQSIEQNEMYHYTQDRYKFDERSQERQLAKKMV